MITISSIVLPSVGIGALSSREADGRANASAGEKVQLLFFLFLIVHSDLCVRGHEVIVFKCISLVSFDGLFCLET